MIAGCPNCGARYRIDVAKLPPEGARLRCSRCETIFRVRSPQAEAAEAAAPAPQSDARSRAPQPVSPHAAAGAEAPPAPGSSASNPVARGAGFDSADSSPAAAGERSVLLAHSDPARAKQWADWLARWGLAPRVASDGVEAILQIQRSLPRAVVLDASLARMRGGEICELMKRNEQLRGIPVVLVDATRDADDSTGGDGSHGADVYLGSGELPESLAEALGRFGLPLEVPEPEPEVPRAIRPPPAATSAPRAPAPIGAPATPASAAIPAPAAPSRAATPAPAAPSSAATPAPASPSSAATPAPASPASGDPELDKGERLARIIVSDVILYNPERFQAGVRDGNVLDTLGAELEEGYALFAQRVDPQVCDPREFIQRELLRVAREKGMA